MERLPGRRSAARMRRLEFRKARPAAKAGVLARLLSAALKRCSPRINAGAPTKLLLHADGGAFQAVGGPRGELKGDTVAR